MVTRAVLIFLALMNIGAFVIYGLDKKVAQYNGTRSDGNTVRRFSEKSLFLWAMFGGALGALVGMKVWHHKTKHWYFVWGVPALLVLQLLLAAWLFITR